MHYTYRTHGVCSTRIEFDIEGDVISNVVFTNGCDGNLKAIAKLVNGQTVDEIETKLKGNTCGYNSTSCADQLAKAVREAYNSGCQ
jgi:uncharacterized protein (TIGR03905 family)